jgi:hypothetical protein
MSDEQCGADPFENGYDQKLSEKEYRERIKYLMRCHDDSADEIERLRAALTATLIVAEKLCEALDVDTSETYIRVKKGKSGETIARRSVAEIVQAGHDALGEEKK